MRKPGIILLHGEPDPCAAVRAALEALGASCEIWSVPDASDKLLEAVQEHDGETWCCEWDADDPVDPASILILPQDQLICRPGFNRAVEVALAVQP